MLQDQVICQTDPELWFSDSPSERQKASEFCQGCWFKDECEVLGTVEEFGVWGGVDRTHSEVPKIKTCRSGKHVKTEPGTCLACRKESQGAYYRKNSVSINRKKQQNHPHIKKRRNVEGGYCVNGHKLEGDNIIVRSNDKALLCKSCIHGKKAKIVPSEKNVRTFG